MPPQPPTAFWREPLGCSAGSGLCVFAKFVRFTGRCPKPPVQLSAFREGAPGRPWRGLGRLEALDLLQLSRGLHPARGSPTMAAMSSDSSLAQRSKTRQDRQAYGWQFRSYCCSSLHGLRVHRVVARKKYETMVGETGFRIENRRPRKGPETLQP